MKEHTSCQNLLRSLSDYVDGELDESFCIDLEQHLCECENCRIVLNTMKKTIEIYHTLPGEDLPEDVRTRLYKKLDLADYIR